LRGLKKSPSPFSFQLEIKKLRIPMPLIELVENESFKRSILKALEPKAIQASIDYVNLQNDKLAIILNPVIENCEDNSPSFYVSLTIHKKILRNYLLDTRSSHNIMPKAVMDELGLDITKPYHDLFTFDSRKVKCLGLIKDLAITLSQLPTKNMIMDIVVVNVPPKFGMLLSRGWIKRLGGSLQNDPSYATVIVFRGERKRLQREAQLAYIINDEKNPTNHPSIPLKLSLEHVYSIFKNPSWPPCSLKNQFSKSPKKKVHIFGTCSSMEIALKKLQGKV